MSPSTADVVARIYKMGGFEVRNERARWEGRIQENHRRIVERGREALAEILVIRQSRRRGSSLHGVRIALPFSQIMSRKNERKHQKRT